MIDLLRPERLHRLLAVMMVGLLGAVEDLYGRTQYMGDWISYLNVSRSVDALDWHGIFNPMWSPGYPILVALARGLAPHTAVGEWYAIGVLNWLIFLATYAVMRLLVAEVAALSSEGIREQLYKPLTTWALCFLFLGFELCLDRASRVSPDTLVTLLMLLGVTWVVRVLRAPGLRNAAYLGVVLGIACWVKGVFVGYSAILLGLLLAAIVWRKMRWQIVAVCAAVFLLIWAPFVWGISRSEGHFTLGVTGELNYAYYVNFLPHWTHWQGGPAELGSPTHHSQQMLPDLPVFSFGEPFHSTYPPYNELAYWYIGYKHYFSLKNQMMAVVRDSYILATIVKAHPILLAVAAIWVGILLVPAWRRVFLGSVKRYWLLLAFPCLAVIPYLLVHVEDRYLAGMALILAMLPLVIGAAARASGARWLFCFVIALSIAGSAAELVHENRWVLISAMHRWDFHRDPQWQLGSQIENYGVQAGDPVALIGSKQLSIRCTWAYISHVRIVAEFGSLPWRIEPPYRWPPHHGKPEAADQDWGVAFWHLSAEDRERVLNSFEQAGAVAAVSMTEPASGAKGWTEVGNSGAWIYNFRSSREVQTSMKLNAKADGVDSSTPVPLARVGAQW